MINYWRNDKSDIPSLLLDTMHSHSGTLISRSIQNRPGTTVCQRAAITGHRWSEMPHVKSIFILRWNEISNIIIIILIDSCTHNILAYLVFMVLYWSGQDT